MTFVNAMGETEGGTISSVIAPANQQVNLTNIPLGASGTTARKIYRTAAGGGDGTQKLVATIANNTATTYTDNIADGSLGAQYPYLNTALKQTQTYGANFRNELEENGLASSMKITMNSTDLEDGIKFFYSGAVQTTPSATMLISGTSIGANPKHSYAQGNVTGAATFDRTLGATIAFTLTGNVTPTIPNGVIPGDTLTLIGTQDATGSRTMSKPANVKLVGGAFSPTATAGATDTWVLQWSGTNWIEQSRSLNLS